MCRKWQYTVYCTYAVCTNLQKRFAIFVINRVKSFTRVLIFRVSYIGVLAAIIVVYVFSCINIFLIILSIFCVLT